MTTLEDLYYGNISPHERYIKRGTRVDKLVKLICKNEEELNAGLTEKQKEETKPTQTTMKANDLTTRFPEILEKKGLRRMRFHDLRHSCASVLLAQGVPMKQIQEWLGHSDMSTTANIYSHLDAVTKADTGAAMSKALG
ncbi:MAG: tyrosine-type recombinase/integrase [Clostridia bacterium]|nr:tyrosine-type recombinase/integrase [Clostridia bacterium]